MGEAREAMVVDAAHEAIRRFARDDNRKVREVSQGIVDGLTTDLPL